MITGSCHCGAVRFELASLPVDVNSCNCSICRRLGTLWAYGTIDTISITGETVGYIQGDRMLETHHCGTCGCTTHWQGLDADSARIGVNARLLDPAVLAAIPVRYSDGASW